MLLKRSAWLALGVCLIAGQLSVACGDDDEPNPPAGGTSGKGGSGGRGGSAGTTGSGGSSGATGSGGSSGTAGASGTSGSGGTSGRGGTSGTGGTGGTSGRGGTSGTGGATGGTAGTGGRDAGPDSATGGTAGSDAGSDSSMDGTAGDAATDASDASTLCGNGTVDSGEECDPPASAQCNLSCRKHTSDACLACEQGSECVDIIGVCDTLTGVSPAGSPAAGVSRRQLCYEALQCARDTNCARTNNRVCYCGDKNVADCNAGQGNGACKAVLERALETTNPTQIISNYQELTRGGGVAMARMTCDRVNCESTCFRP